MRHRHEFVLGEVVGARISGILNTSGRKNRSDSAETKEPDLVLAVKRINVVRVLSVPRSGVLEGDVGRRSLEIFGRSFRASDGSEVSRTAPRTV